MIIMIALIIYETYPDPIRERDILQAVMNQRI